MHQLSLWSLKLSKKKRGTPSTRLESAFFVSFFRDFLAFFESRFRPRKRDFTDEIWTQKKKVMGVRIVDHGGHWRFSVERDSKPLRVVILVVSDL